MKSMAKIMYQIFVHNACSIHVSLLLLLLLLFASYTFVHKHHYIKYFLCAQQSLLFSMIMARELIIDCLPLIIFTYRKGKGERRGVTYKVSVPCGLYDSKGVGRQTRIER